MSCQLRADIPRIRNAFFSGDQMKAGFKIGDFELTWLNGGLFELDGGTMFGVVPKVLWQKK